MRLAFKPADLLSLAFMALMGALAVCFAPVIPTWKGLLALYGVLAALTTALAIYRKRAPERKLGFYLSVGLTVVTILLVFNSMGAIIAGLRHRSYDGILIAIDQFLFGVNPTVWTEKLIHPVLTAVLQFAYISYYFIPISLGIVLIARNKHEEFEKALFGIVLCFYLSYLGYLLVPATGPRFTLMALQTEDLHATPFIKSIQDLLNGMEQNKTDAFPSGHTAIALMCLYYADKYGERKLFGILLPVVLALVFSTVYLRYHYVIDVIAGFVLTAVTIGAAPGLRTALSRASGEPGNQCHCRP